MQAFSTLFCLYGSTRWTGTSTYRDPRYRKTMLRSEVLLAEEEGADGEAHEDAAAADHGHDRDEGFGLGEGLHVDIIGPAKEEADERDGPGPVERRGFLPYRIPHETRHDGHHQRLIEGVPAEDLPAVQAQVLRRHQVLVIQPAGRAQNDGENQADKPFVARANAFLLPREPQHHIGCDGEAHTDPLQQVQPLPEQEDGTARGRSSGGCTSALPSLRSRWQTGKARR